MTNALTFYLKSEKPVTVAWLKDHMNGADITTNGDVFTLVWSDLTIRVTALSLSDSQNRIAEFIDFVRPHLTTSQQSSLDDLRRAVGVVFDPGFDAALRFKRLSLALMDHYNGIVFVSNPALGTAVYNAQNELVFGGPNALPSFFPSEPNRTPTNLYRKARSVQVLQAEGVRVLPTLPVYYDDAEVHLPDETTVVKRALALLLMANIAGTLPPQVFDDLVAEYKVGDQFYPDELEQIRAIRAYEMTEQERNNLTWVFESFWVLMWAANLVDDIGRVDAMCDTGPVVAFIRQHTLEDLVEMASLRSVQDVLDVGDMYYRYHWACVSTMGMQPGVNCSVVYHRRYAIEWLVSHNQVNAWGDIAGQMHT